MEPYLTETTPIESPSQTYSSGTSEATMQPLDIAAYTDFGAYVGSFGEDGNRLRETLNNHPPAQHEQETTNSHPDALGTYDQFSEFPFPIIPPNNFLSDAFITSNASPQPARHPIEQSTQRGFEEQPPASVSETAGAVNDWETGDVQNGDDGALRNAQNDARNNQSPDSNPMPDPGIHQPGQLPLPASTQVGLSIPTPVVIRPTRDHPRAATIPGMTPGRTRCDTCHDAHKRCDHGPDGFIDPVLAARPHKKVPAHKNRRTKRSN